MKFVLKNLTRRKLRSLFSVLGVGIGVSIMVALFTISDDFIGQIHLAFQTQRGDIVVTQATAEELESDIALYHEETLRSYHGVKVASPMIAAILRTDADFDDRPAILYYGIRGDNPLIQHMKMEQGETISDEHPNGVVFGWRAWDILQEKMGKKAPVVGQPLDLMNIVTSEGFTEVFDRPDNWDEMTDYGKKMWALMRLTKELGVHPDAIKEETPAEYEARTGRKAPPPRPLNLLGLPYDDDQYARWLKETHGIDYDPAHPELAYRMKLQLVTRGVCRTGIMIQDSAVFFHLNVAQVIKGKHERTEKIKVRKGGKLVDEEVHRPASCTVFILEVESPVILESRDEAINRVRDAINRSVDEVRAARSEDVLQRHKEIEFFEKFALVISLIAALAGAIGILNTMTLSVFERTREIGLLLAVGWSRLRVLATIMLEGLVLSVIGGLAGIAFGYAEVQVARVVFSMDALSGSLNIQRSLDALGLAMLIGFGASMYPALRAALLQPIDALRHE